MSQQLKFSYYVRLLVNGRVVGTSDVLALSENFTLSFRDVFRQVFVRFSPWLQWPWEIGLILACCYHPLPECQLRSHRSCT